MLTQKFGDRERYEPRGGFSFAPGGPGAICYKPQPICSLKSLIKNWWYFFHKISVAAIISQQKNHFVVTSLGHILYLHVKIFRIPAS